jgi:hypothetical protein
VERALDAAPVGIGGEDEPLAGRPQLFDLETRPSLQRTTSSARVEGKLSVIALAASSDRAPRRSGGQPPDALACWRRSPVLAAVLASSHSSESEEKSNERKGAVEMRRLKTSRRFAGLIAVFLLATGITAASAQTEDRRGHGERAGLELTYTKWFAPGFPNMVGVVGGDIVGPFGGAVLDARPDDTGRFFLLKAIYIVVAPDPSRSLTIRVKGAQDIQARTAVLDGRVVDGPLTGARAHAEFKVISCTQAPNGECFQGTISIKQRFSHNDEEDDDD